VSPRPLTEDGILTSHERRQCIGGARSDRSARFQSLTGGRRKPGRPVEEARNRGDETGMVAAPTGDELADVTARVQTHCRVGVRELRREECPPVANATAERFVERVEQI
jgi:hypothetical protein